MSQVLQWTQLAALMTTARDPGRPLVHGCGAEVLARIAEFGRAALDADARVGHQEMGRLVLLVDRARPVHVGELVHRGAAVEGRLVHDGRGFRTHRFVVGVARAARDEPAAAGQALRGVVDDAGHEAALEGLPVIPVAPQLRARGGSLEELAVPRQRPLAGLARSKRLRDRLGREHPRLDGEMHALQRRGIEQARRVADQAEAVAVELGDREVASLGHDLGAVAQHLAALEEPGDARMLLPAHEESVRIETRVALVEADDEADRELVGRDAVDERAAVALEPERMPRGVEHLAEGFAAARFRDLPELLDAGAVALRIAALLQAERADELLRQVPARALPEDGHVREDPHARLKRCFARAVLADPAVARLDAANARTLEDRRCTGEAGVDLDPELLGLLGEPAHHLVQADDHVSVILERRRDQRAAQPEVAAPGEEPLDPVLLHLGLDGKAARAPVGKELLDAARIHHASRERVMADLLRLLDDEQRLVVLALRGEQPPQVDRAGERRRTGAHEEHVDGQLLAFDACGVQGGASFDHARIERVPSGPIADPVVAVGVDLFLPYGEARFQLVDQEARGPEGLVTMGTRDGDHDRGLADGDDPDAVHAQHAQARRTSAGGIRPDSRSAVGKDPRHLRVGHLGEGLVVEAHDVAVAVGLAGRAREHDDRSAGGVRDARLRLGHVQGGGLELEAAAIEIVG